MVNEDSPIKEFYPVEFSTDLNGKQQEWEAVVLIPFIDEVKLMAAMEPCSSRLDKEVWAGPAGSHPPHSSCVLSSFLYILILLSVLPCWLPLFSYLLYSSSR